jgi:aryl-alcohol dehydrogenase-like predicted oxidoreductase
MKTRKLGRQGLEVSELGLGCMSMSHAYGDYGNEADSIATIHRALDLGVTFFDTAEVYGPFTNEKLLGRALKGRFKDIVIATKFGWRIVEGKQVPGLDSSPANIRKVVDESLQRLGTDHIDLLYQHRVDPNVQIEEVVGVMGELVRAGKVRYLGLSEAGATTIRRAHATHPIAALQSEYSLWERGIEAEVIPTLRELGIGLVPYSPLGRGLLTGNIKSVADFGEKDFRRGLPRLQGENFDANLRAIQVVHDVAKGIGATSGQVAIAWVLQKGDDVVPIPGTKRVKYLEENLKAADVKLSAANMALLDAVLKPGAIRGDRYAQALAAKVDRS